MMAGMFLAGCTQTEVLQVNQGLPINFSPLVTRAAVADLTYLKSTNGGFMAYGQYSNASVLPSFAPNFFNALPVNYVTAENKWKYPDPLLYWPIDPNAKYKFYAYAPLTDGQRGATDETAIPSFTYTINDDVTLQKDLLYSTVQYSSTPAAISLHFNHALSCISFAAKKGHTEYGVKIKKIVVKGDFVSQKKFTIDGTWATAPAPTVSAKSYVVYSNTTGVDITTTSERLNVTSKMGDNTNLMIIPQTSATNAAIVIDYEITQRGLPIDATVTLAVPAVNWEKGKRYVYTLDISLDAIIFDNITVEDWADQDVAVNP